MSAKGRWSGMADCRGRQSLQDWRFSANNAAALHPFFKVLRGHPEQGKKAAPRDLDRAQKARARYEHAELFLCKRLLCVCGTAALLLRSHCGAKRLVVCSLGKALASQTSVPLRFTQDDTDGCAAQHLTHKQCGCVFVNRGWRTVEDASPYKIGDFPPTTRLHSPPLVRGGGPHERWWGSNNAIFHKQRGDAPSLFKGFEGS